MSYVYQDYSTQQVLGKRFYDLGRVMYPSITTVLGHTVPAEQAGWLDAWKARVGKDAAEKKSRDATTRGTNVHLMLERLIGGEDPRENEFPSDHAQMFRSLKLEAKKINKAYGQEVVLYSDAFEVAGRCDLVGEWQGVPAIIDYKTAGKPKTDKDIQDYWLQATFYALAHNEMFGTDIQQLVILMGVEGKMPRVFKSMITDERIVELAERTAAFYDKLGQEL